MASMGKTSFASTTQRGSGSCESPSPLLQLHARLLVGEAAGQRLLGARNQHLARDQI